MNYKIHLRFTFLSALIFTLIMSYSNIFSQETKLPKKALDAFMTATTKSSEKSEPVPGAEITVEQIPVKISSVKGVESGPAEKTQFDVILKSKLITNDKGEFTLELTPEQMKKLPEDLKSHLLRQAQIIYQRQFYYKNTSAVLPINQWQLKNTKQFLVD